MKIQKTSLKMNTINKVNNSNKINDIIINNFIDINKSNTILNNISNTIIRYSKNINKEYYNQLHNNIRILIQSYFAKKRKIYISDISIVEKNKVYIHFIYYSKKRQINYSTYKKELQVLRMLIQEIYKEQNKEVVIVVNRVRYPFINSQIFAINIAKNLYVFREIRKAGKRSNNWNNTKYNNIKIIKLPFTIKGIRIELHGRLLNEHFKPRDSKKTFIFGNLLNSTYVDQGFYTSSNRKGSFTIKIWIYTINNKNLLNNKKKDHLNYKIN